MIIDANLFNHIMIFSRMIWDMVLDTLLDIVLGLIVWGASEGL